MAILLEERASSCVCTVVYIILKKIHYVREGGRLWGGAKPVCCADIGLGSQSPPISARVFIQICPKAQWQVPTSYLKSFCPHKIKLYPPLLNNLTYGKGNA